MSVSLFPKTRDTISSPYSASIRSEPDGTATITGNAQFVVAIDIEVRKTAIYQLDGINPVKHIQAVPNSSTLTSHFIYGIGDRTLAERIAKIFPYDFYRGDHNFFGSIVDGVLYIGYGHHYGLYNMTGATKYVVIGNTVEVHPHTPTFGRSEVWLPTVSVRDTPSPTSTSYNNLSIAEREQYVPTTVADGKATQINVSATLNWVSVDTCIYNGSLTYVRDADMDRCICMSDDNGRQHNYDVELFRKLIPHMFAGVVTGKFRYCPSGSGSGKTIKYGLVLYSMDSSSHNLLPCDSDSDASDASDDS